MAKSLWHLSKLKYLGNIDNQFFINGNHTMQSLIWDDIRIFLVVARTGTISKAAELLGIGVATVSRKIERLENTFGMPLFLRHQAGYRLTEDGAELLEKAKAMEITASSFLFEADIRATIAGSVRFATLETLANHLIMPNLSALQKNYPNLTLEITTDIYSVNLHRRDADLALRIIRPEQGHVNVRQVGSLGFGLYGSETYLATCPAGVFRGEYNNAHFIGWTNEYSQLPSVNWLKQALQGRPLSVATTSICTQIAAANAGLGLAVLPHIAANDSGLICISSDLGIDKPIWLVIQSDLAHSPRIRKVADFLAEVVSQNQDKLSG
ncbi:LysR family transcriptional regulator [Xenorhabdus anantnagensis]|uniref:LysR family transcriptional regulator n=1 Tax=Xenorhabdus anantnagensis TaxID=3025875 RepID=A0ABT5LW64_9GAMM|nr:LysR family transcriptional regulator [Xenorhabdus anantnagensis]MDC9597319.1 LysR family transcriptional regulator [Xenorhabdus anantnagensis]